MLFVNPEDRVSCIEAHIRTYNFASFILNNQAAKKENQTISVRGIMDTWILQMNCPVVKVSRSSSGNILLEQKRFLTNAEAVDPGKYQSPYK